MDLFGHIAQLLAAAGNALTAHHQTVQQTVPGRALQPANGNPQSAPLGSMALAHGQLANLHSVLAGNPSQLQAPGGYNHFQPAYGNPQSAPMGFNQYQSGVLNPQGGGAMPQMHGQIQMPQLRMLQLYSNLGLQGSHPSLQQSANPQVRNYNPQSLR